MSNGEGKGYSQKSIGIKVTVFHPEWSRKDASMWMAVKAHNDGKSLSFKKPPRNNQRPNGLCTPSRYKFADKCGYQKGCPIIYLLHKLSSTFWILEIFYWTGRLRASNTVFFCTNPWSRPLPRMPRRRVNLVKMLSFRWLYTSNELYQSSSW